MHQRDYILRLIEQLGSALVALRNLILGRRADPEVVDAQLASMASQAGLDLELLRGFTVETLHMFVSPTGEVEPARCWLMAEVLYLDGLQALAMEAPERARPTLLKARVLYTLIEPFGGMLVGIVEAAERVDEIDRLLAEAEAKEPLSP